jgi:hypothetical protein
LGPPSFWANPLLLRAFVRARLSPGAETPFPVGTAKQVRAARLPDPLDQDPPNLAVNACSPARRQNSRTKQPGKRCPDSGSKAHWCSTRAEPKLHWRRQPALPGARVERAIVSKFLMPRETRIASSLTDRSVGVTTEPGPFGDHSSQTAFCRALSGIFRYRSPLLSGSGSRPALMLTWSAATRLVEGRDPTRHDTLQAHSEGMAVLVGEPKGLSRPS